MGIKRQTFILWGCNFKWSTTVHIQIFRILLSNLQKSFLSGFFFKIHFEAQKSFFPSTFWSWSINALWYFMQNNKPQWMQNFSEVKKETIPIQFCAQMRSPQSSEQTRKRKVTRNNGKTNLVLIDHMVVPTFLAYWIVFHPLTITQYSLGKAALIKL